MALIKSFRCIFAAIIFFSALSTTFISTYDVQALSYPSHAESLPSLNRFISQVKNGQSGQLRGVYVPELLAATVVQQPKDNNAFVSSKDNTVTQFGLASRVGSTGLLAHNNLAGASFSQLGPGQKIFLVYGDGQISAFVVTETLRYQALTPRSPSSKFIDLKTNDILKASEVFSNVYERPEQVVFQTCISNGEEPSWGRLFVIAEPSSH